MKTWGKNLTWYKLAWLHGSQTTQCLKQLRNWLLLSEWRLVFILPLYLFIYLFILIYADLLPCLLELECLTHLLSEVFCGQRGERAAIFCADGRSTVQWSGVYLLISSKEADNEEVQFCDSLTINNTPNLILFLHFFGLKTRGLRFILSLSSLPFLCLICILYRAHKHGLSAS